MKNTYPVQYNKSAAFITAIAAIFCFTASAQNPNVGFGTTTPASKATINGSFAATYKVIDADVTLNSTDYYLSVNSTANRTITLPAAVAGVGNFLGRTYHIKNTGTFTVTIAAAGTELIDNQSGGGVANIVLPEGYYCTLISKGTTTGSTWESIILPGGTTSPQYINCVGTAGNFPAAFTSTAQLYTPWVVSTSNGLSVTGGYMQLTPGYTYKLECSLYANFSSGTSLLNFKWVDGSNTAIAATGIAQCLPANGTVNESAVTNLCTIYTATPGNGAKIGVWISTTSGTFRIVGGQSTMSAIQTK